MNEIDLSPNYNVVLGILEIGNTNKSDGELCTHIGGLISSTLKRNVPVHISFTLDGRKFIYFNQKIEKMTMLDSESRLRELRKALRQTDVNPCKSFVRIDINNE